MLVIVVTGGSVEESLANTKGILALTGAPRPLLSRNGRGSPCLDLSDERWDSLERILRFLLYCIFKEHFTHLHRKKKSISAGGGVTQK